MDNIIPLFTVPEKGSRWLRKRDKIITEITPYDEVVNSNRFGVLLVTHHFQRLIPGFWIPLQQFVKEWGPRPDWPVFYSMEDEFRKKQPTRARDEDYDI